MISSAHDVSTLTTSKRHGDFRIDGDATELDARRRATVDLPWVWVRQVHGAGVVRATKANAEEVAGTEADAIITTEEGIALAVHTADCAPVVLTATDASVIGVAHAGWRGLRHGVIEATIGEMRALGATSIRGALGPCIHAECYEFGTTELDDLAREYGEALRGTTSSGQPALDMVAAVGLAARRMGVEVTNHGACTACERDTYFSHRARSEDGRMATVVWRAP